LEGRDPSLGLGGLLFRNLAVKNEESYEKLRIALLSIDIRRVYPLPANIFTLYFLITECTYSHFTGSEVG